MKREQRLLTCSLGCLCIHPVTVFLTLLWGSRLCIFFFVGIATEL
uniref:Uncharacterized protein n=1 Tax=Anguilla anguilla TaxID=7936 RepID=A0A0E9UA29_ANGAN